LVVVIDARRRSAAADADGRRVGAGAIVVQVEMEFGRSENGDVTTECVVTVNPEADDASQSVESELSIQRAALLTTIRRTSFRMWK
jgi:hypothetical protein